MAGSTLQSAKPSVAREVVVYDGQCAFCTSQMERIRRRDVGERFEYAAWQTPGLSERFPQLGREGLDSGLRLVTPDGEVLVGADAVYAIFRHLRGWRWVAWLYRVPVIRQVCRWVYRRIAANRYRLGGRCASDDCTATEETRRA